MANHTSLLSILCLVLVIVLLFAVLVIYLIYFLNRDISSDFGAEWDYVVVSDTATEIRPTGHQVLAANGGSSTRGSNQNFLYIGKPSNVPYVRRIFVVYNTSESAQLELRGDGINFECGSGGNLFIDAQTGQLFIWKNEDTVIPIVKGTQSN